MARAVGHYSWFRTYDPEIGRFLNPDLLGQTASLNVYDYAEQNPILNIDPLGLFDTCDGHRELCTGAEVIPKAPVPTPPIVPPVYLADEDKDPVTGLEPVNPGRCGNGCNPCPPPLYWRAPGNNHGSTSGYHFHGLVYHQNPKTCVCIPKRVSGPSLDRLK
jgi:hypothetical protein